MGQRMKIRALLTWVALTAAPAVAWGAPQLAIVTIADGSAVLIRDAGKLALAEGVHLRKDDIVETGSAGRLLRIEFADGLLLDLGPGTRAMLSPRLSGDKSRAASQVHLLTGMAKVSVPKGSAPAAAVISSPAYDVRTVGRSAVFVVQHDEAAAFAESGEVLLEERVPDRTGSKAGDSFSIKAGEFYSRRSGDKGLVTQRPTPAFIQQLPRAFVDSIPSRAALLKDRDVEPRRLDKIEYADVGAWLAADGLRAGFVTRWKAQARDPAFRSALIANLRAHPEWDRTLYPQKYQRRSARADGAAPHVSKP
jgi:hypothetical protein